MHKAMNDVHDENDPRYIEALRKQEYDLDFDSILSAFYANLLLKQEPLGKEFTKVLYDNLWDLYES